jgi:hypothetical protein
MGASIFFTAAMIHAFRSVRSRASGGTTHPHPPLLLALADLKAWIIAAVKNINPPMLTHVWQELEYHINVCHVTRGANIEHL